MGTHLNCIDKSMQFKWVPTTYIIKGYVVGIHLNCIDKLMQFKWVPTTYAFIKKKTKIHSVKIVSVNSSKSIYY